MTDPRNPPARSERREPAAGQESVWDYPRPPRLEPVKHRLVVAFAGEIIAHTVTGYRICETSHPPTFYIPAKDVRTHHLEPHDRTSFCEFKGQACYWTIVLGERRSIAAAWSYPNPMLPYAPITNHYAFYPSRVDECFIDEERVTAQEGDFYGGWITSRVVGPFKGGPGTWGW